MVPAASAEGTATSVSVKPVSETYVMQIAAPNDPYADATAVGVLAGALGLIALGSVAAAGLISRGHRR
ncbi:hypothetical protein [Microbacterium capsulatum]|nr:hypothetical protein [Microbacterium sp. ASV81]